MEKKRAVITTLGMIGKNYQDEFIKANYKSDVPIINSPFAPQNHP